MVLLIRQRYKQSVALSVTILFKMTHQYPTCNVASRYTLRTNTYLIRHATGQNTSKSAYGAPSVRTKHTRKAPILSNSLISRQSLCIRSDTIYPKKSCKVINGRTAGICVCGESCVTTGFDYNYIILCNHVFENSTFISNTLALVNYTGCSTARHFSPGV